MKEVKGFLGLTGYYRRAIGSYASIASPLTKLLKKLEVGSQPTWDKDCEAAFMQL